MRGICGRVGVAAVHSTRARHRPGRARGRSRGDPSRRCGRRCGCTGDTGPAAPGILSDILSALAANADPLTSGLLGIASTLNPQVGSAQPIVIPTPIGELDVIALYIASIATGSIALAITNTARPWHIGLYGNAGGLGPTQGHPLSSATDEPEPHWGPFGARRRCPRASATQH